MKETLRKVTRQRHHDNHGTEAPLGGNAFQFYEKFLAVNDRLDDGDDQRFGNSGQFTAQRFYQDNNIGVFEYIPKESRSTCR